MQSQCIAHIQFADVLSNKLIMQVRKHALLGKGYDHRHPNTITRMKPPVAAATRPLFNKQKRTCNAWLHLSIMVQEYHLTGALSIMTQSTTKCFYFGEPTRKRNFLSNNSESPWGLKHLVLKKYIYLQHTGPTSFRTSDGTTCQEAKLRVSHSLFLIMPIWGLGYFCRGGEGAQQCLQMLLSHADF